MAFKLIIKTKSHLQFHKILYNVVASVMSVCGRKSKRGTPIKQISATQEALKKQEESAYLIPTF